MDDPAPNIDFKQWLIDTGKSEKTANNYAQTIKGSVSKWANEHSICDQPLLDYNGAKPISRIVHEIRELDIYKTRNDKGKGMYRAALRWFEEYAVDRVDDSISRDIDDILIQDDMSTTEKNTMIAARVGQGSFRDKLVKIWGQCAATGYTQLPLLIASHIKPWKQSDNAERLDPYNGLLLNPNLDKAFDRNFISFDSSGEIIISDELEEPDRLSIYPNIQIAIREKNLPYMEYHRNQCFRG